ncbi:MAG TPA: ADOP family duplicated permease [Bryobacteraceae bacterium]|jgi:predicted permease|nr:ADOP family duplicated permease [Bryobacteraceae bacterium]
MGWLKQILSRRRRYDELAESMREHLEEKIEDLMEDGLSREEATRTARRDFGNVTLIEERSREVWQWHRLESVWRDGKHAVRQLRHNPGFTATVVLTLALSIGANTAIFSIVNALLLKSLPYAQPDRIGTVYARTTGPGSSDTRRTIDGEQWGLLRDDVPSLLSAVSSLRTAGVNLQAAAHVQYVYAGRVSAHYFDVLALHPIIGRNFSEDEDRPHGSRAAIISYALWRTVFAANPNVLAQPILLKGEPYSIIGVLPEHATTPLNADLYTALQPSREGEGQAANFWAIVRLRDGASWQAANAELNRAWARSFRAQRFEKTNPGARITYYSVPLQKGQTDTLRPQVLALMLAAGFILLIACANLAGLTLVRMLRRTGEIATRLALGGSPWQIQRQLWIENLLLALVGGSAGIGVGFVALRGLLLLLPEHFLPVARVPLDSRVLGFTLSLSLLTSVLFGMLPALTTRKVELRFSMASRVANSAGSLRLRQALIAGEVALTVVLLAAAGLLIRTLIHLETMPPGFNPVGVIAAKASLDDVRYHDPAAFRKLLNESLAAMREIPGVENAAVGLTLPYERALLDSVILTDGPQAGREITTNEVYLTPGYFDTLHMPVVAGRAFTEADGPNAQLVVVVNQTFARKFFQETNPVGSYLKWNNKNLLIVGVVGDTVLSSASRLNAGTAPLTREEAIYLPAAQMADDKFLSTLHMWFQPSWVVRAVGPSPGLTAQMQRAFARVDPNLPFSGFYSMRDLMVTTLATQRIEVALLAAMASLALLLSAVGIFALVANIVAQRTREIGIRIALGSTIRKTMIHIGRSGASASALGLIVGLVLCAGALRAMRSVLYGVGVYDLPTILLVMLTLSAATILATTVPALRVARIDPAKTLREE